MPKQIIRNLQYGVGLSLLFLIASSVMSYLSIQNQLKDRENLSNTRKSIGAVKDVIVALVDAETGIRGFQITGRETFLEPYNRATRDIPKLISNAKATAGDEMHQISRLDNLEQSVEITLTDLRQFADNRRNGRAMTEAQMMAGKANMDKSRQIARDFVAYEEGQLEHETTALNRSTTTTVLFIIFSALTAVAVSVFFYNRLRKDLIRRDLLERELKAKDLEIRRRVSAIQQVANRVAAGDYSQKAADSAQDDLGELAEALNNMTDSLKQSFDKINRSDWQQKGLALLNESLVGNKTVKAIVTNSLRHLVDYAGCTNGAIYLADDGLLQLTGAVGLEKNMKSSFAPGEGMVGESFVRQEMQLHNDLRSDNYAVSFVSGSVYLNGIVLLPIHSGDQPLGVLELGSTANISADQVEFFKESSRNIAVAVGAARSREQEQRLFEETQAQAEELQVQHSELENLNTELEAQTQKLQASEEELKVQQEELMQTNAELEERSKLLEEKNLMIAERNKEIQKKAEELALSTKYKSEFLANMSHELRTPLNSILLLSRLMAENPDENLNEDQVESAKVIQSSGSSLLTLIDEILDLTKIESGKMALEFDTVSIGDVVKDLSNLFNPLIQEKGLKFNVVQDEETPDTIETDRLRLDQVLRNLMSNALKFTEQGSIDLKIKNDPKHEGRVIFSVKDTGIGIPADKQRTIFEAFQQADGSTRRKFGGTGLGLSISREIAKLLGGELTVASRVDEGSEFFLSIPVRGVQMQDTRTQTDQELIETIREDVEEIEHIIDDTPMPANVVTVIPEEVADDREDIATGDKVILIVEDDTNFATALLKYTHLQQYKGIIVVRGDHALPAAIKYHPLAILLDIQLPVKDGWQVMDELKSHPQTRHIPVHMMSSLHVKQESLMRGAIDFINKPVALEQMSAVFKKIEDALSKGPHRVLIVEENAMHASALSYFLSNFDISSKVENSVEDSVKALTTGSANCVILNIERPSDNKYTVIESIKSNEGLENLPIIIFTGHHLTRDEELKIKQYADSIVVKTAHSYRRILDEVGLFLHLVEEKNTAQSPRAKTLGSLTEVLSGKKVLITDDDARNIFSLTKTLEKHKMEVVLAMDGKQALEQMKQHPDIDVVLMDMMMPEMDGYETIREIRKMPKYNRLPIIAVTAKSMQGEREKCITAGASDYISKPVDIDQLLSLLRVWLYETK